jgi:stalled ribosome alternative rescue factor ArfA
MNNKFSPIDLRAEWSQFRENIITVVLGIKSPAFRKRVEQVKS